MYRWIPLNVRPKRACRVMDLRIVLAGPVFTLHPCLLNTTVIRVDANMITAVVSRSDKSTPCFYKL